MVGIPAADPKKRKRPSALTSHNSSINLVVQIVRPVLEQKAVMVEVCKEAEDEWCETIQSALRKTVLTDNCSNVRTIYIPQKQRDGPSTKEMRYSNIPIPKPGGITSLILLAHFAFG